MAGTIAHTVIEHRPRGVVKTKATWLADASGDASATPIGVGFGDLVGILIPLNSLGSADSVGNTIFTLSDGNGAQLWQYDTDALKFGDTTTGDTTGGAAEDLWTTGAAHGMVDDDTLVFLSITDNGAGGPTIGTLYYVDQQSATTFILRTAPAGGGTVVNVGAADATAASWVCVSQLVPKFFRPTMNVSDSAGVSITAADTAPNVMRNIPVAGKLQLTVAQGGNLGTGDIYFIVDEAGLHDPAITV